MKKIIHKVTFNRFSIQSQPLHFILVRDIRKKVRKAITNKMLEIAFGVTVPAV